MVVKPNSGLSTPRQRQLEQLLSGCCAAVIRTKAHPHTAISITLQVENDGGSVSGEGGNQSQILCFCADRFKKGGGGKQKEKGI